MADARPTARRTRESHVWDCGAPGKRKERVRCGSRGSQPCSPRVLALALVGVVGSFEGTDAFVSAPVSASRRVTLAGYPQGSRAYTCGTRRPWVRCSVNSESQAAEAGSETEGPVAEARGMTPPPDREAALQMVANMNVVDTQMSSVDALEDYSLAFIPSMPMPPYFFEVPGEFGKEDLCTDPEWHTALLALKWLGFPCEVRHGDNKEPRLLIGDEVFSSASELMSVLPERVLLSDFVDSLPKLKRMVGKLPRAWEAVWRSDDEEKEDELQEELQDVLDAIDRALKESKGTFLEGDELTVGDLDLAVTMYHMMATLDMGETWTDSYPNLARYVHKMHGMQIFGMVMPSKDDVARRYKA